MDDPFALRYRNVITTSTNNQPLDGGDRIEIALNGVEVIIRNGEAFPPKVAVPRDRPRLCLRRLRRRGRLWWRNRRRPRLLQMFR